MEKGMRKQLLNTPAFRGEAALLSNFAPYEPEEYYIFEGIAYPSNEHFYQAMKIADNTMVSIKFCRELVSKHGFKGLKGYIKNFQHYEDWHLRKLKVMEQGLRYKFSIPRFRDVLLATGDLELVERNHWGDTYWGVYKGEGENNLGKILMQIRQDIQNGK